MNSKKSLIIVGVVIVLIVAILLILSSVKKSQFVFDGDNTRPITTYSSDELTIQPASVDSVTVELLESFPVQVRVTAIGNLRNGCEEIYEVLAQRSENLFTVTMNAASPKDAVCTQVLRPFKESFALDVSGLPAGTYTVNVNGVLQTFVLAVDNVLDFESSRDK